MEIQEGQLERTERNLNTTIKSKVSVLKIAISVALTIIIPALASQAIAEKSDEKGKDGATLVPTLHCIGNYWSPPEGSNAKSVSVKFRQTGQSEWFADHPLQIAPIDTPESKGDYRGSLVNLTPGTSYDIELPVEGTDRKTWSQCTTWSEELPVKSVVSVADQKSTFTIDQSGSPEGYILYDDSGNSKANGIAMGFRATVPIPL